MEQSEYNDLVIGIHSRCNNLMSRKRSDYANDDVLSNFKRMQKLCAILDIDPRKSPEDNALYLGLLKIDRICNLRRNGESPKNEPVIDSVVDLHNYIDLAYACSKELDDLTPVFERSKSRE